VSTVHSTDFWSFVRWDVCCFISRDSNFGFRFSGTAGQAGVTRFTGLKAQDKKCVSVLVRGSNQMLLDETERSLHDALCVVRSLVKRKALIPGGAAPEMELSTKLAKWARGLGGVESICIQYYAEALERVPYTLAENAGLNPIQIVTALRKAHVEGQKYAGISLWTSLTQAIFGGSSFRGRRS